MGREDLKSLQYECHMTDLPEIREMDFGVLCIKCRDHIRDSAYEAGLNLVACTIEKEKG